jgi:hypothetical protein
VLRIGFTSFGILVLSNRAGCSLTYAVRRRPPAFEEFELRPH